MAALSVRLVRSLGALLAGLLAALALPAAAQDRAAREHEIKAAFLFKFPSFIEWPGQAGTAPGGVFSIGVLGAEEVGADLQQVAAERTLEGRPVTVRTLRAGESPAGLHMLFVGREHTSRIAQIARMPASRGLLIVSEEEGALDQGSAINFVVAAGRVRFQVNLQAAERSGLRISSRLLAVASEVRPARP